MTQFCFSKSALLKPLFLFFGGMLVGQVVKNGNFGHPPKKIDRQLKKYFVGIFVLLSFFVWRV